MKLFYKRGALLLTLISLMLALVPGSIAGAQEKGGATATPSPAASSIATPYPAETPTPDAAQQPGSVRWGFYITYNPNSLASLQTNARYLNYISPWFYNLNSAALVAGREQPQVNTLISSVGAKNLPMLKNTPEYNDFTAVLTDTNKQLAIVDQISKLIEVQQYDGITIDFEGVNASDKDNLTTFMVRLYSRLHSEGKLVAMAVAPKIRDITSGWAAAYDYSALAAATDFLLIMAYDYHYVNGDPGPIAPMPKLEATADYTLAHVPANKVIWGVGVYGLDWGEKGKTAEYRNWAEANSIAAQPGAQSDYDQASESPWIKYTRDGIGREVWYENKRSFDAKVALIKERGMAGFGIWRLGQEDPGIWDSIKTSQKQKPAACKRVDPPAPSSGKLYFQQTGHTLGGRFLQYWQANGGLPIFGYPLTEEFKETSPTDGHQYTVQYFERNRFELHPENKAPNDVLLGLLGVQITKGRQFPLNNDPAVGADTVFFPQVAHAVSGSFLLYWQKYGGLIQFGFPISDPVLERSDVDGKTYTVQYMERARFELHPEYAGSNAEVLLGLLGLNVSPCK